MKTQKLKKPCTHYSWNDQRTPEEIEEDIERRKNTKEQRELDFYLSSPEAYQSRKTRNLEVIAEEVKPELVEA